VTATHPAPALGERFDVEATEEAIRRLIEAVGEDPDREGLRDSPRRIAAMYREVFDGLDQDPAAALSVGFEEGHDELVILREIPFHSMCEHHFMPFHGQAHVGYLPNGRIVGLSKIARAVEIFARRPQVQERLTTQIGECIEQVLDARGVGVVIEAEHLCMTMRGIRKPGSKMVTSAMRGAFRSDANTRQEFLELIRPGR
jgi:GTP cyclohydrolase I